MKKANILTVVLLLLSLAAFAQKGIIRGEVLDNTTGEPLIGVTALIEGTSTGAVTDFEGKFEIAAAPGVYNLQISYVSYAKLSIKNVNVTEDEVTMLDNIRLQEDVERLTEVVVTAEALKTTEEAILTVKRKSANLIDGISSANFRKIGDSDAASAIKRVSGVSVEGGKYVYIRGLGDRYTKSTLNGVAIPGLDPDRNTVQMDMFPSSLLDNIIVYKSFTADLPADFTGGIVDIATKDFPDDKIMSISASAGYNPAMHFNNDYLTYQGGSTDFLGFDDGTRDIPTKGHSGIPQYADVVGRPNTEAGEQFQSILKGFNPTLAAMRDKSAMDVGLGFNLGDQMSRGKNTIGYNFSVVYKNETEYYEDVEYSRYGKGSSDGNELEIRELQKGDFGVNNVTLSGIAGIALKRDRSKYKLNFFHSQNGTSKAGVFAYDNTDLGANFTANQHNLEYSERFMTNILLNGLHFSNDRSWELEWKLSPTRSRINDPDVRYTRVRTDAGNYTIGSESGYPERIWRSLEEANLTGNVDATKEYQIRGNAAKLKFGGGYVIKQRDYEIQNFQIVPQGVEINGDPDQLFKPENLWPTNTSASQGTRYEALFLPNNPNKYNANASNAAMYVSNEFRPAEKLKAILGVRAERYMQHYTGINQQGMALDNEPVMDDLNFFPTVNLIYSLTENQNLRFSYSKTIARPSFKEASFAQILDPLTGRAFIGGFFPDVNSAGETIWDGKLTATRIDNFDVRWELFKKRGQTIAVSGFYKTFDSPIEIVQYVQSPNNFQPRNVGDGKVLGIEVEVRQQLDVISDKLHDFAVNGNFTVTNSQIEMSPTEYESRKKNAAFEETVKQTRDMAGQAPYLINAGISYNGSRNSVDAGIFYNMQGETLQFVGIADRPDVYTVPFHSLNFNANKTFGEQDNMRLGIGVSNILGSRRASVFKSFGVTDQLFESLRPGTAFKISFGYSF